MSEYTNPTAKIIDMNILAIPYLDDGTGGGGTIFSGTEEGNEPL